MSKEEEIPLFRSRPEAERKDGNSRPSSLRQNSATVHPPLFSTSSSSSSSLISSVSNSTHQKRLWLSLQRFLNPQHWLLFLVAILYGSLDVSLRAVYATTQPPSASALSTVRGWLGVFFFLPLLWNRSSKQKQPVRHRSNNAINKHQHPHHPHHHQYPYQIYLVALELAVWNLGAQGFVTAGLLYISSAARASFWTQLSVVITPLLAAVGGTPVPTSVRGACAMALLGLVLLSHHHKGSNDDSDMDHDESSTTALSVWFRLGWSLGDLLCVAGALSWSTYLLRLSAVGDAYPEVPLQALKNIFLAALYTVWWLLARLTTGQPQWTGWDTSGVPWMILCYSAAGPGVLADIWQQQAQSVVSATVANVVLSLEPVFTAIFGRLLLGETTTWVEKCGGLCILVAALVATHETETAVSAQNNDDENELVGNGNEQDEGLPL